MTNQDVVAVMLDNRPEHVFSWMSVCKIGARVSLINHNFRSSLLLNSLTQTQSKYLIIGYELANEIGKDEIAAVVAKGITVMVYGGSIPGAHGNIIVQYGISLHDVLFMLYTLIYG